MKEKSKNYAEKTEKLLGEMPGFVSDFIYNFGQVEKYATKLEYCRDIRYFFNFIVTHVTEYDGKTVNELTLNDIASIEPLHINRYLSYLSDNGSSRLKLSTIKRRRASLSSMYSFFILNGMLKVNPIAATHSIKLPDKDPIYLNDDEQITLLDTVRYGTNLPENTLKRHEKYAERDYAIFLLMLDTGLRVSEILGTDIRDFNLSNCSVMVIRKGGDIQNVYYSDECSSCLLSYFKSQKQKYSLCNRTFPAFTTTTGNRLCVRSVETLVKKYIGACLPEKLTLISPHKLRSSFAMSFYEASGNDILLLQKKLNHKSITTTNVYARASDKANIESRNLLQELRKTKNKLSCGS